MTDAQLVDAPTISAIRRAASLARKTHSGGKEGRPRSRKKRCPCQAMTAKRAKARGHKCESPLAPETDGNV